MEGTLVCSTTPGLSKARSKNKEGGARGVMVTVLGGGHGDTSSNPGRD